MSAASSSSSAKKPSTNTFPILNEQTITVCLSDLGINIDEAELKAPKSKTMFTVYAQFVDVLMGVNADEALKPPQFAALDVLEHQELHETSLAEIMFVKSL